MNKKICISASCKRDGKNQVLIFSKKFQCSWTHLWLSFISAEYFVFDEKNYKFCTKTIRCRRVHVTVTIEWISSCHVMHIPFSLASSVNASIEFTHTQQSKWGRKQLGRSINFMIIRELNKTRNIFWGICTHQNEIKKKNSKQMKW